MASERRIAKIRSVAERRQRGLVIVLEDIHDPHNAEAIFRSCDAFGIQEVYLVFGKEKPWNPRKIGKQSSSSAHKWLTFHNSLSVLECLSGLKKKGYFIVGSVLSDDALSLYENDFSAHENLAIIVGNEHSGLSVEAKRLCDALVKIPMRGMLESLNVSVAAAVFLGEITRQRVASGRDFALKKEELEELEQQLLLQSTKRKQHA